MMSRRGILADWLVSGARAGAGAINNIEHVANVLFVRNTLGGFHWKIGFRSEVRGQIVKQLDAGYGFKLIAAHDGMHGNGGLGGSDALTEASFEMGILAKRVEFAC